MNFAVLFSIAGCAAIYLIALYQQRSNRNVKEILRANRNVPPLFMLRSSEIKVNAVRAALNSSLLSEKDARMVRSQLDSLNASYRNREIPLVTYYSKVGALLIRVNEMRAVPAELEML